jgi:hypothetical protein
MRPGRIFTLLSTIQMKGQEYSIQSSSVDFEGFIYL